MPGLRITALTRVLTALAVAAVAGCSNPKISDTECVGLVAPPLAAPAARQRGAAVGDSPDEALQAEVSARVERVIAAQVSPDAKAAEIMEAAPEDSLRQARPVRRVATINLLAMTTGGQYGAFSSGFLTGWGTREDDNRRPDFAVVTGASAGGIVAPIVFAGPEFDPLLRLNTGIDDSKVLRKRGTLELLSAASLYGTGPLQRKVHAALTDDLVGAIATKFEDGNDLILGATNLDTGRFDLFDIGKFAADAEVPANRKRNCLTEAIMATSAIPALFPPRRIQGDLYTDAGVRQSVFLAGFRDAVTRAENALNVDVRVNAYLIVNSDLKVRSAPTETGLIGIAGRSFELIADEGLRQSLRETVFVARRSGWRLRAVMAPEVGVGKCISCKQLFSKAVTEALFNAGRDMATAPEIPWISGRELARRAAEY